MIRFNEFNEEVLYATDPIVQIDRDDIADLVQRSDRNPRARIRICSHRSAEDKVHEMLIVHARKTYVPPHKHLAKSESFHVIEGLVDVVLFDEAGKLSEVIPMGDYRSGRKFYYRLSDPCYHTLLINSDHLVFHETTNGPFDRADTVFAPWAPDPSDAFAVEAFMDKLVIAVNGAAGTVRKPLGA
jgi:cupin fold WbuC family metalloprotein